MDRPPNIHTPHSPANKVIPFHGCKGTRHTHPIIFDGISVVNWNIKLKLDLIQEATQILYENFRTMWTKGTLGVMYVSRSEVFLSLLSRCDRTGRRILSFIWGLKILCVRGFSFQFKERAWMGNFWDGSRTFVVANFCCVPLFAIYM